MHYQLEVQQIIPDAEGLMNVMLMVGTPTHIRQQLIIKLQSSSTLIDFFETLQIEMAQNGVISPRYAIQYKQFGSICQVPIFTLLEEFSTIDIMTEEIYDDMQNGINLNQMEIEDNQSLIEKVYNVSCHHCKTRKDECFRCPINPKHKFCHGCIMKYITLERFLIDGCPICSSKCQCASCKRKELKRIGIDVPIPKR